MTKDLTVLSDAELSALFKEKYDAAYRGGKDERWTKGTQAYCDRSLWLAVAEEQNRRGSVDPLKIPEVRESWVRYRLASARIKKELNSKEGPAK
jgi:hypothetical protein